MQARDIISDIIPAVKTSDTGSQVLSWMDHFRVSHLPIVNHISFLGLISDNDIYSLDDPESPIGAHSLSLFSPFAKADQHIMEVLEIFRRLKISLIPVLNNENDYLGCITLYDLLQAVALLNAADHQGAILVFNMTVHDYSLTEIARIVEENQAKILSSYVTNVPESTEIHVTIKINTTGLTSIIRSFERYGYQIESTYMESGQLDEMYWSRYEEFMRYLNI